MCKTFFSAYWCSAINKLTGVYKGSESAVHCTVQRYQMNKQHFHNKIKPQYTARSQF